MCKAPRFTWSIFKIQIIMMINQKKLENWNS